MKPSCCSVLVFVFLATGAHGQVHYRVDLTQADRIGVTVESRTTPSRLYMQTGGSGSPDGFVPFVKDLQAASGGAVVRLERTGAEWKIAGPADRPVTITYNLDLSFTRAPWPAGNEQAGYSDGDATYLVTKALFLESDLPGERTIAFKLPTGKRLAIPWTPKGPGEFVVQPGEMLQDSLVYGNITPEKFSGGRFHVEVVLLGQLASQTKDVGTIAVRVAEQLTKVFPVDHDTSYLITLIPGKDADGEAFPSSFASTMKAPLRREERIVWANTIAHEVMHHWLGHTLKPVNGEETAWLTEGFSEYFANLALARTGIVPPEDFLQLVSVRLAQYEYFFASPLFSKVTLRDAGTRKSSYRFGVYSGGWAIAFVADQELRASGKTLEDVIRTLLARPDHNLTFEGFLAALKEVGGDALAQKITHALTTRDALDVDAYLAAVGIGASGQTYAAEKFIYRDKPNPAADRKRRAWAGF